MVKILSSTRLPCGQISAWVLLRNKKIDMNKTIYYPKNYIDVFGVNNIVKNFCNMNLKTSDTDVELKN